ncbi:hypothetical protein JK210_07955 [Acetobacter persici]|nr:hypothetical protein [Acetobacter persici]
METSAAKSGATAMKSTAWPSTGASVEATTGTTTKTAVHATAAAKPATSPAGMGQRSRRESTGQQQACRQPSIMQ